MDSLRPLNVQARRHLLRWRTNRGRATAIRYLDLLAVTVAAKGFRCVKLYQADELPTRPPLLWVFAFGPEHHVRIAVSVRATSGATWAYHEAGRGRRGYLAPCGDTKYAAEQVDAILKHHMFPDTW
ncbi:hypothetical protein [Actinomadura sp. 7K507]|uniref:hypothetical protein n=1 Tax=Actinomadura sp. 7K507 TaxID=2530365 RepID=UPI001FB6F57A|nr:hypothetical protein [Actinomadura sp. 7K507]